MVWSESWHKQRGAVVKRCRFECSAQDDLADGVGRCERGGGECERGRARVAIEYSALHRLCSYLNRIKT